MTAPNQGSDPTNIQGFADTDSTERQKEVWEPVSDRKIRMGIAGYGVCRFGTAFGFQHHPNVEVAAVCDIFPDRCAELAAVCNCQTTYSSVEEMVKDPLLCPSARTRDAPPCRAPLTLACTTSRQTRSGPPAACVV